MMGIFGLMGEMSRRTGTRSEPECVVFDVAEGAAPGGEPPVRIFLGTEPDQQRAERVFLWSVLRHRDPARVYEIYLMKDLVGFDRRGWTTGFTNYRFAIPDFAGRHGRAIYNDVDQIYLADPAELFDLDMGDYGFLAIAERESSVMLIDCARMAEVWNLDAARREGKKRLLRKALAKGLHGPLAPEWNSRDEEYDPERAKLVHFTTLHTQPWRPFPSHFLYRRHPHGDLWHDMERAADAAGFQAFTRQRPSRRYRERLVLLQMLADAGRAMPEDAARHGEAVAALVHATGARQLLDYRLGPGGVGETLGHIETFTLAPYDAAEAGAAEPARGRYDGVVCLDALARAPEEDVPWMLDDLFACARSFVYAAASCEPDVVWLAGGEELYATKRPLQWWQEQFEAAGRRHPGVGWELAVTARGRGGRRRTRWQWAGRWLEPDPPRAWVLADDRPEDREQSIALAEALGWPYEVKQLHFNALGRLDHRLLDSSRASLERRRSAALAPPWPDAVIAAGAACAPIARWIGEASQGRSRLVQIGRKTAARADAYCVTVAPAHARLPYHPRRIETTTALSRATPERLAATLESSPDPFGNAPRPRVVLLVGGSTNRCRPDAAWVRRMVGNVAAFARAGGGSLQVVPSGRIGEALIHALEQALQPPDWLHPRRPQEGGEANHAALAAADAVVVAADSETLLADAAAAGRPLYLYDLPKRRPGPATRLAEAVVARALAEPLNDRGTARPQQGLERLCGRLLARGLVRPPRDPDGLREALLRRGVARAFGAPLETGERPGLHEAEAAAARVKEILGLNGC